MENQQWRREKLVFILFIWWIDKLWAKHAVLHFFPAALSLVHQGIRDSPAPTSKQKLRVIPAFMNWETESDASDEWRMVSEISQQSNCDPFCAPDALSCLTSGSCVRKDVQHVFSPQMKAQSLFLVRIQPVPEVCTFKEAKGFHTLYNFRSKIGKKQSQDGASSVSRTNKHFHGIAKRLRRSCANGHFCATFAHADPCHVLHVMSLAETDLQSWKV